MKSHEKLQVYFFFKKLFDGVCVPFVNAKNKIEKENYKK